MTKVCLVCERQPVRHPNGVADCERILDWSNVPRGERATLSSDMLRYVRREMGDDPGWSVPPANHQIRKALQTVVTDGAFDKMTWYRHYDSMRSALHECIAKIRVSTERPPIPLAELFDETPTDAAYDELAEAERRRAGSPIPEEI